jgi:hypothetical protein
MQKAGVRSAGCSDGDAQQPAEAALSTSSEFIIYSGKKGGRATVLVRGRSDNVVIGNRGSL